MAKNDSVDKIVTQYFAAIASVPFRYKGAQYTPKPLTVSPLLWRGYTCPAHCAGCCAYVFTLDYLPFEELPYGMPAMGPRIVEFDGRSVCIRSDRQEETEGRYCKHVDKPTGRCIIHGKHPFSCDFELIRPMLFKEPDRPNLLISKLYGRGWLFPRVDGSGNGALCEMLPSTRGHRDEVRRKLKRLWEWASWFGLPTMLGDIITYYQFEAPWSQAFFNEPRTFYPGGESCQSAIDTLE